MLVASHSGKVMVDVWSQAWLSASLHLRDIIVAFSSSSSRFDHVGERKSSRVRKAETNKLLERGDGVAQMKGFALLKVSDH